jgi:hypothetical protein
MMIKPLIVSLFWIPAYARGTSRGAVRYYMSLQEIARVGPRQENDEGGK